MAAEHGDASAQRARLDCEQEQGAKRLKVDPACLVSQAGSMAEFGEGIAVEQVKQEPDEERWQGCEAQRQPFPKIVGTPTSEQRPSGEQGQSPLEGSQQPRSYEIPALLFGLIKEPQATPLAVSKTVCKIAKGEFPVEVGREEVIPGEDTFSWDVERRRFREFCYYEAVGPTLTSVRLGTLCRQWLQPEKHTKQQILERVIMEQFLAILPQEMQSWVKAHRPDTCPRAVALAEGFLLIQEKKRQAVLQKEAASVPQAEEPQPDSCQRPPSREIKQEEDSDPTLGGETVGEIKDEDPVREIKEEHLSQEDSLMESLATAEGSAQESLSSPSEPGLVGDLKEEPGTTCNPDGGTVRKIKEENLSEEEFLTEAAAPTEGGAQQSIAFPSGSAVVRFPKEEPGTTCSPLQTMEFSRSQKNNKVMLYLGFEYLSFRTINGVVTWRCRQNRSIKCHSIIKTKDGNIVQEPTEHCHDSCPQKAAANVARSKMREDMRAVSATPHSVMGNVLSGLNNDILAHMPRQSSLARSLHYHRTGSDLPNPKTISFDIPEKYRQLILYDSGVENPDRILVLGDRDLMLELNKDTIYGDGTFDKVPNVCYQLYTWHARVGNSYPPCIYFLLQKKNMDTYGRMFEIMKLLIPDLAPQKVLVDFEKACMNAARIAFPHTEIKGCYFHLCQSLIRKINSIGLKTEYEANMNIKITLKSLAALAFVPIHEVRTVFDELAATFPDEDSYNEMLTYFFSTYIEGAAGRDPPFPIRIWNHHDAALERSPETTNCCEGFHNALNSLFHCSHPSVWSLFDGLQRDLACHKLTLANAQAGCLEVKKRKYEALHDMVAASVQQYEQVEDKLNYLRRLANLQ